MRMRYLCWRDLKRLDIISGGTCILQKKHKKSSIYKIHESPSRSCNYLLLMMNWSLNRNLHTNRCTLNSLENRQLPACSSNPTTATTAAACSWALKQCDVAKTFSSSWRHCELHAGNHVTWNLTTEQRYAECVNSGRKMETIVKHRRTIGLNMSFFWLCRTMAASAMVTWPRWFFEVDWKVRLCKPVGCNPYLCPITACRKSMDWNIKLHIATSKTSRTCFFWMLESSFVQLCSKALSWPDSLSRVAIPTWDTHSRRQMVFFLGLWMIILLLILHACKLETIRL